MKRIIMPKFGDWIMVRGRLSRIEDWANASSRHNTMFKKWVRQPFSSFEPARKGIFLGKRTLANGRRYHHYDEGFSFEPDEHITAYLVCTSPREKPFYVHPDDVEIIDKETP